MVEIVTVQKEEIEDFFTKEWNFFDQNVLGVSSEVFDKTSFVRALMENNTPVAVSILEVQGGVLSVRQLIVAQNRRSLGFGTKMIQDAEKQAKLNHCHKVVLRTTEKSKNIEFYKKNGYSVEAILNNDIQNWEWYILSKFLWIYIFLLLGTLYL